MAEPEAEQAALCVLVKTKEPKIEWHTMRHLTERTIEYLAKAEYAARGSRTSGLQAVGQMVFLL